VAALCGLITHALVDCLRCKINTNKSLSLQLISAYLFNIKLVDYVEVLNLDKGSKLFI